MLCALAEAVVRRNALGKLTAITDLLNNTHHNFYDTAGRLDYYIDRNATTLNYDLDGPITLPNRFRHLTTLTYVCEVAGMNEDADRYTICDETDNENGTMHTSEMNPTENVEPRDPRGPFLNISR